MKLHDFLVFASIVLIWHQTDALTKCPPQRRDPVRGVIRSPPVAVPCDFCVAFFDEHSSFMQTCGSKLDQVVLDKLIKSCDSKKDSQIEAFVKNIELFCEVKKYVQFDRPSLECGFEGCDICETIFKDDSDFTKNCGQFLPDEKLKELRDDCELRECGTGGLVDLEAKYLAECEASDRSFEFPECECNECFATFRPNSEFMQGCGSSFSQSNIDQYIEDCDAAINDVEALLDFFTSLQEHCDAQGKEVFEIPTCNCDNVCWAIQDTFSDFYKNCFGKFDDAKQESLLDQCFQVVGDTTSPAFEEFVELLEHECKHFTGRKRMVPRCLKCQLSALDIIYIVDTSTSMTDDEFDRTKQFILQMSSMFTLGEKLTRIAIVNYADEVQRVLGLSGSNSYDEVVTAISGMSRMACDGVCTNTAAALIEMSAVFGDEAWSSPTAALLLTDGRSNVGDLDQALANIPADVTMFTVAFGGANEEELLKIAGDIGRVFEAADVSAMTSVLDDLRDQICS